MSSTVKEMLRQLRCNSSLLAADLSMLEQQMAAALVDPDTDLSEVLLVPLDLQAYAGHLMKCFDTAASAEYIRPALLNYCRQHAGDPLSKDNFARHFLGLIDGQLANRVWDAADVVLINSSGMGLMLELFVRQQADEHKAIAVQMFWLNHEEIDRYRQKLELEGGLRRNLLGSPDEAFTVMCTVDVSASPLQAAYAVLDICFDGGWQQLPQFVDKAQIKALEGHLHEAAEVIQFHRQQADRGRTAAMKHPDLLDEWMLSVRVTGWRDA